MRGTLTGGSVGLLRYPAMLPCFSRLWGMILHCRKSPCRLEITADSRGLASGFSCLGDHPRVCGEHFVPTIMGSVSLGSSRVCGEHRTLTDENGEPWGSSPRMRGTHQIRDVSADIHGIIPAYAGNTRAFRRSWLLPWDHPRVCGEHSDGWSVMRTDVGSSPRMRGTLSCSAITEPVVGIIPAYAGNTYCQCLGSLRVRDHPRVCGEHLMDICHANSDRGSSPRMRGTRRHRYGQLRHLGIIPAYAGNTLPLTRLRMPCWDHPRVCGEHVTIPEDALLTAGSSPRMRGTLALPRPRYGSSGIIPAYAGNT